MKTIFVTLLFVVSTIFSVSAQSVAIHLSCGHTVMTDSSSFDMPGEYQDFVKDMEEIYC